MKLHTIQLGKWRKCKKLDIELVDITVMSGETIFAPTWDMVNEFKNGTLTEEDYYLQYKELMTRSYKENKAKWLELLQRDEVAIACFCKAGSFCHRRILVSFLQLVAKTHKIEFSYEGELE